ncbi:MAG: hypothetical protein LBR17_08580, partial [Bacteroidales bacterium]|nr:hypothetical protein [Bacteroidales bacterium]
FSTFYNFIVSVAENIFGIFGYVYRNSVACYRNLVARYENSVACYENFVACYENSVACYGNFVVCYRNLVACYENFVACYENLKWFPALTEISKYQININIETQDNLRNLFTFFKKKRIIRSSR